MEFSSELYNREEYCEMEADDVKDLLQSCRLGVPNETVVLDAAIRSVVQAQLPHCLYNVMSDGKRNAKWKDEASIW